MEREEYGGGALRVVVSWQHRCTACSVRSSTGLYVDDPGSFDSRCIEGYTVWGLGARPVEKCVQSKGTFVLIRAQTKMKGRDSDGLANYNTLAVTARLSLMLADCT